MSPKEGSFHFVLQRTGWGFDDLYEAIKTGKKNSEWRDGIDHWKARLLTESGREDLERAHEMRREGIVQRLKPFFLMNFPEYQWKHKRARFVVGYTKRPMLLADVTAILYYSKSNKFEVQIANVQEVIDP